MGTNSLDPDDLQLVGGHRTNRTTPFRLRHPLVDATNMEKMIATYVTVALTLKAYPASLVLLLDVLSHPFRTLQNLLLLLSFGFRGFISPFVSKDNEN